MSAIDGNRRDFFDGPNGGWLGGLLLVFIVALVYAPARHAGFLWDDDTYITANPSLVGLHGLKRIWTSAAVDISPLTSTTFWLEHAVWGVTPLPYHLVNVLMHGACSVALWRVLRALSMPGAWLGAAIWALHPVQVESVAWASELKNPESGLFFLLAILFFVKWARSGEARERSSADWNYGWALLFGALAMASKSSTVILPAILCLYAWWTEGRWRWGNLLIASPFLLLSIVASLSSIWFEKGQVAGMTDPQLHRAWLERFALAGDAVWFYFAKLVWPFPLATIYPGWNAVPGSSPSFVPLIALVAAMLILWTVRETRYRWVFFVFAYFEISILPVLGFVNNYIFRYSLVFDHFQYLASMLPLAVLSAGIWSIAGQGNLRSGLLRFGAAAVILIALGIMSWQRTWVYENAKTYWTDSVAKNPGACIAYVDLGIALLEEENVDDAVATFRKAVTVDPHFADAYVHLGDGLERQKREDEAMANYLLALKFEPKSPMAYCNIGIILMKRGKVDEGLRDIQKSVELASDKPISRNALGGAFIEKGELDHAADQFRYVLTLDPKNDEAHFCLGTIAVKKADLETAVAEFSRVSDSSARAAEANEGLGDALSQLGRLENAVAAYRKALEIDPTRVRCEFGLGLILAKLGRLDEAITELQKAVRLDPRQGDGFNNLGNVLLQKGRLDEAAAQYQKSLEIDPTHATIYNNLGAVYFRMGKWDQAIAQFQKMSAIDPRNDAPHYYLGLLFSKKGTTSDAIAEFQKAVTLNPKNSAARANLGAALLQQKAKH